MNAATRIAQLSPMYVIGIGIALLAGYYYAMYDDGTKLEEQKVAVESQIVEARARLTKIEKASADLKMYQVQIESIKAEFAQLTSYTPTEINIADVQRTIAREIADSGAQTLSLQPSAKGERMEFLEKYKFSIELEGGFAQIVKFYSNMSKVPRLFTFEAVRISPLANSEKGNRIKLTGDVIAYRFLENQNPTATAKGADANAPAQ